MERIKIIRSARKHIRDLDRLQYALGNAEVVELQSGGEELLVGKDADGTEIEFVLVTDRNGGGRVCIHAAPAEWRRK